MVSLNLVQIFFALLVSFLIISFILLNCLETKLPSYFSQLFRYGKFRSKLKRSILTIEVPKSWFRHFYVVAVILCTYTLILVIAVYTSSYQVPKFVYKILNTLCGEARYSFTTKNKIILALFLLTLQVYRRFYDTFKVSVFGTKAKINISHYLIGHIHYLACILAILCEAPIFASSPVNIQTAPVDLFDLTYSEKIAIFLYLFAWKHQYICTKILANLRKDPKGKVITNDYKLPEGDWFKYLSAPHQTAEIIMYSCLMWLLWYNITWFYVYAWVLLNQIQTILLSHWWYKETFPDFPKNRKALIPFEYKHCLHPDFVDDRSQKILFQKW